MECLSFNILKLSPASAYDLETRRSLYFVENVVHYNSTIRQKAISQLVTGFMGKCKKYRKYALVFKTFFKGYKLI